MTGRGAWNRLFDETMTDLRFHIDGERAFDRRIVDQVEFEREEQKVRAGVGHLLLDVAIELGALGIGGVSGINQSRIGDDAADQFLQRLVGDKRLAQPAGAAALGFGGQRTLPAALETGRIGGGLGDVALQLRRVHAGIEVGKVPFRQVAQLGRALTRRRRRQPPCGNHVPRIPMHCRHLPWPRFKEKREAGQILRNSFTGFFETLFRTLCQDGPQGRIPRAGSHTSHDRFHTHSR
nr:hypothetical protein [Mesorhizobium sp. M7A.F.Ca.AU.002.06.1.1]